MAAKLRLYEWLFIRTLTGDIFNATPLPSDLVLRRFIGILLIFTFGSFSLEELVADVHDGDAPASEVAKAPANYGNVVASSSQGAPDAPLSSGQSHTYHVCHCVHAHGMAPPAAAALGSQPTEHDGVQSLEIGWPAPVDLELSLRPPIRA